MTSSLIRQKLSNGGAKKPWPSFVGARKGPRSWAPSSVGFDLWLTLTRPWPSATSQRLRARPGCRSSPDLTSSRSGRTWSRSTCRRRSYYQVNSQYLVLHTKLRQLPNRYQAWKSIKRLPRPRVNLGSFGFRLFSLKSSAIDHSATAPPPPL